MLFDATLKICSNFFHLELLMHSKDCKIEISPKMLILSIFFSFSWFFFLSVFVISVLSCLSFLVAIFFRVKVFALHLAFILYYFALQFTRFVLYSIQNSI